MPGGHFPEVSDLYPSVHYCYCVRQVYVEMAVKTVYTPYMCVIKLIALLCFVTLPPQLLDLSYSTCLDVFLFQLYIYNWCNFLFIFVSLCKFCLATTADVDGP